MALLNNFRALHDDETWFLDKDFLRLLDLDKQREVFAKIVSLDIDENPVEEIQGRVTSGSVSVDGTSAVRRTCSLSLVANELNIHDYYWGLKTKFKLYIGLTNRIKYRPAYTELYQNYPDICWFKMGTYLISTFNTSQALASYTISIQGKDKMAALNGEFGGIITPLSWDFGQIDVISSDGTISTEKYLIKDIITEAVHKHANEPFHNIIVNDLDDMGLELMEYRGDKTMFMYCKTIDDTVNQFIIPTDLNVNMPLYVNGTSRQLKWNDSSIIFNYRIDGLDGALEPTKFSNVINNTDPSRVYTLIKAEYGDVVGYRITDLVYAGDLISNIGESVTSMLDKIKDMLGEFEYFYDLDGRFIFQKKPCYIKSTFSGISNNEASYKEIELTSNTYRQNVYWIWNNDTKKMERASDENFDSNATYYYLENEIYLDTTESAAQTSVNTYSFENDMLITSFANTPDFANLKNDYSLWGVRKGTTGIELPIHLRYAIDTKPWYYKSHDGIIYITQDGLNEYERLRMAAILQSLARGEDVIIDHTTGDSIFHITPLPAGLSNKWWEIDDWARRYLYYADVNNTHNIRYYLSLSSQEIVDIVNSATQPTNNDVHDFNYFVYQLKALKLGNFHSPWYATDWLSIFPQPAGIINNYYYNIINQAVANNQTFWVWLFDTALTSDGKEYIKSIEHGYQRTSGLTDYPTSATGCNHVFSYALSRKQQGATSYYHSYIYDPSIPDTIKSDDSFSGRIDSDLVDESTYSLGIRDVDYIVVDWREIIYQMALDYNKHHHDEDFLIKINNLNTLFNNMELYPGGYTKYEQYYIDLEGFWRDLYDPKQTPTYNVEAPNKATFESNQSNYYIYKNCKDEPYAINRTYYILNYKNEYVALSSPPSREEYEYIDDAGNKRAERYYYIYQCTQDDEFDIYAIYHSKDESVYNSDGWAKLITERPEALNFWFDFLDTEGDLGRYKACRVGDRTKAENDTNIKSIYYRDVPTVIFTDNIEVAKQEKGTGYTYVQLPKYMENLFSISAQGKSAMDKMTDWLQTYGYCVETISVNALPVYYLEPNTRIFIRDDNSKINGEYLITRLTFPLTHNGTMQLSATKAVENLY